MTSQSPAAATGTAPDDYVDAWRAISIMVANGASWSARERNHVFLNIGRNRFADVSALSAANAIGDGRGIATVDWDDDGRLDLFLKSRTAPRVQFFRNENRNAGAFLAIELVGVDCNRDAIGARVVVEAGGRTTTRTLYAGTGYLAQSSKRLHFGLGSAERADRLTVLWPDGSRDDYEGLAVDRRYRIVQGATAPETIAAHTIAAFDEQPSEPIVTATHLRARVPLVEKLPLNRMPLPSFEDEARRVSALAGGPVLLNLWSTTCASCLVEFGEFRAARERIDAAGLRIVTVATDGRANRARALELLEQFGLTRDAGYVNDALLEILAILFDELIETNDAFPLPTSLLLDEAGQAVAIYPGKLDIDEVLLDVAMLARMDTKASGDSLLVRGFRVFPRKRDFQALGARLTEAGFPRIGRSYVKRQKSRDQ